MSFDHLLIMPGTMPIVDVNHPDCLDWREVGIALDMTEDQWIHFWLEPKSDGRTTHQLGDCTAFELQLRILLIALFDRFFSDRPEFTEQFRSAMTLGAKGYPWRVTPAETLKSFLLDANGKKAIRRLSSHDKIRLAGIWSEMIDAQRLRHSQPARP